MDNCKSKCYDNYPTKCVNKGYLFNELLEICIPKESLITLDERIIELIFEFLGYAEIKLIVRRNILKNIENELNDAKKYALRGDRHMMNYSLNEAKEIASENNINLEKNKIDNIIKILNIDHLGHQLKQL